MSALNLDGEETALTLVIALAAPLGVGAAETVVVRERSGKVIEKRITRGNRTEIRSPNGKLLRVEIRKKDRIEARAPSARLIQTKKLR